MRIIAINGSPRKTWNTATLLNQALEGAQSQGAGTELIHLYDLKYKGCISCFACKLRGGKSYGRCAVNDDLTPVFEKLRAADGVVFGSPIYFGGVTGEMKSFLDRLLFQHLVYDLNYSTLFPKKIPTGFIYTMNVPADRMTAIGYEQNLSATQNSLARLLGPMEVLYCNDTYQFDDYAKYEVTSFSAEEKAKVRQEQFPRDCQKAFDLGVRLAEQPKIQ